MKGFEKAMELLKTISKLIELHQEGPYWDFKKEWYGKEKDEDQLIDIICMANNLVDRDAYIIIGIDEENDYSVHDVLHDNNRRNTQQLTDFLRNKEFAGDFRPVVTVESLSYGSGVIDVIVIHNSLNTPFYLKKKYKGICQSNIYVRLQDSNTPKDKSADFHHVEYLWKKHFGMLLSPMRKVMLYLQHPEDWENSPSQEDKKYYKYDPAFIIAHNFDPEDGRNGYEYYLFAQEDPTPHWSNIRIYYYQTVIEELGGAILDGGRYFTVMPDTDGITVTENSSWDISFKYLVKGGIKYLVHEFYYEDDGDEARHAHNSFENCILIFNDEDERTHFKKYVTKHWDSIKDYADKIYTPYMEDIPGYNMEAFRKQYKDAQILRRMLDVFRADEQYGDDIKNKAR